ncbi:glycosyltransferase family 39 protein [Lacinutrix sp. Bg11-31]|uniref:glycosyltransferase family 39 protein n=1 Tax=Lacinutrix sp. Bg11-31 TaxID=2057808 RepID=UPI000C319557|nr:glycosyltransferase family 39 protein [Lacinutrix sp. Bg11-31]AUC82358.1 hypothetical protein CW733_09515 [Lacinutrix sp. Bg11-31]
MKAKHAAIITSIVSLIGFIYFTFPYKLGLSPDSVSYIFTAESILKGNGVVNEYGVFVSHWPPLYTILLALVSKITLANIQLSALYLNAVLIFSLPILYFQIIKAVNLKYTYKILLPIILVVSWATLRHRFLLTEGLFLTLLLLVILFFLKWVKHNKIKYLIASGLLSSLLILTRYAGIGFLAGFCFYLLFIQPKSIRYKFKTLGIYIISTSFLFLIWLLYYKGMDTSKSIREFQFHPISWLQLISIFKVMAKWIISTIPIGIAFLFLIIVGLASSKITTTLQLIKENIAISKTYLSLIIILIVSYILFIIIALTFFDSRIPISNRIFSCLYPLLLMLIALVFNFSIEKKRLNNLVLIGFVLLFCGAIYRTSTQWIYHYNNGTGYTAKRWKNSEVIKYIESSDSLNIYSNAHDIARFYKNINNDYLPFPELETYQQDLDLMEKEVLNGNKEILYFNNIYRPYFITKDSLLNHFKAYDIRCFEDGFLISKPN